MTVRQRLHEAYRMIPGWAPAELFMRENQCMMCLRIDSPVPVGMYRVTFLNGEKVDDAVLCLACVTEGRMEGAGIEVA